MVYMHLTRMCCYIETCIAIEERCNSVGSLFAGLSCAVIMIILGCLADCERGRVAQQLLAQVRLDLSHVRFCW